MNEKNIICFHNPEEENGYLSNWYLSDFVYRGTEFSSMEQFMMYHKAVVFSDENIAKQIMRISDVGRIKELGRMIGNYNDTVWSGLRQIIIFRGLMEKFGQNPELKEKLLSTGTSILAECAVNDRIWGIGLSMKDPDRLSIYKWRGSNYLGFALMAARRELRLNEENEEA